MQVCPFFHTFLISKIAPLSFEPVYPIYKTRTLCSQWHGRSKQSEPISPGKCRWGSCGYGCNFWTCDWAKRNCVCEAHSGTYNVWVDNSLCRCGSCKAWAAWLWNSCVSCHWKWWSSHGESGCSGPYPGTTHFYTEYTRSYLRFWYLVANSSRFD